MMACKSYVILYLCESFRFEPLFNDSNSIFIPFLKSVGLQLVNMLLVLSANKTALYFPLNNC
jgi:hypothetical protein